MNEDNLNNRDYHHASLNIADIFLLEDNVILPRLQPLK